MRLAVLTEFFCIGFLASVVATVAASSLAFYISVYLLNIDYQFNWQLALFSLLGAIFRSASRMVGDKK